MKRPNLKALQKAVKDWNDRYPVGTRVTRYRLINPLREPQITETETEAYVACGHSAVIHVKGVSGWVILESVVPISTAQPTYWETLTK